MDRWLPQLYYFFSLILKITVILSMQLSRIRKRPGASVYCREHGGRPRRGLGHGRHHCSLIMVHTCHLRIVWLRGGWSRSLVGHYPHTLLPWQGVNRLLSKQIGLSLLFNVILACFQTVTPNESVPLLLWSLIERDRLTEQIQCMLFVAKPHLHPFFLAQKKKDV